MSEVNPAQAVPIPVLAPGGVEAVDRALRILSVFRAGRERRTLAQIAEETGFYKSTILRLARSLERGGYLHRDAGGTFMLGAEPMRLAAVYRRGLKIEDHVRPVLQALTAETGESASFFRREGDMRLCLFREETRHAIRDHITEGDLLPLDVGAAGHVLTLFSGPASALPELPVVSVGERDMETAAMAVPVFGHDGLIGALTLSGPRGRFDADRIAAMGACLIDRAAMLSERLGGDQRRRQTSAEG